MDRSLDLCATSHTSGFQFELSGEIHNPIYRGLLRHFGRDCVHNRRYQKRDKHEKRQSGN